ncbi:Ras association (RalGDS/AF-6) domain, partial [Rhizoctonia solani]
MQAHGGQPRRPSRQDTIDLHRDDLAHEGQGYQHYDDGRYASDDDFHTQGVSVMEDEDDQEEFMDEDDRSSVSEIPDPSIDFDLVYSLHTFVATVEGQANVSKGDSLFLMDDSNSYWWLVRVLKSQEVGYIPAENIETPYERLARLNKHRNVDLASATQQERTEDTKSIRERDRRQRYGSSPVPPPKSVVFGGGSNEVFNYPPAVWNEDEYEGDEWDEDEEGDEYEEAYEDLEDDSGVQGQSSNGKVNPADFDPDDGMSWEEGAADESRNRQTAQQQHQGDASAQAKISPGAQQAQLGLGLASTVRQGSRERLVSGQSQQSQQSQDTARGFDPENITETKRVTATPAIARDLTSRQNGNESNTSISGLQLAGQGQAQSQQRPSQEEGKRSREEPSDSENGDSSRKRGKDNRSFSGDRKLRKERNLDGPDTDGEGSGKESKDKKKKGGVLAGLFGRGKKDKKEKDNVRRAISSQDSETSLAARESDDSLSAPSSYTLSPPETGNPVFPHQRRPNPMDPKRSQPSNGPGAQTGTLQASALRMQRTDQEQQARFHQSFSRSPSSPPDPAMAFGTQSAATQLRNLHTTTHNGRPGSLILIEGNQPLPELSVLRVFAGERVESEATFKTVLVNADTTSTKLVHQAMQRFRLANAEDPSEYYLTVKSSGGAEAMLHPDERPLLVFEAEQARAPTVKRSSVGSINSIASNLSAMPAIAKLGMNDFADDSAVKFYLNRKPSPKSGDGSPAPQGIEEDVTLRAEEIDDTGAGGGAGAIDDDTDTLRGSVSYGNANGRPHLTVAPASQGSVPPERFTSPSARFSVQVVIYPEDLPEGMVFDPHTEAIVPRGTLQHRSQSGIVASPGISQTQRRKVLNFPKNTTVAEVIEAGLERFGILEGVVEGGDDVEEKMTKRRSHSRVRYGLAVLNEGHAERDLLPSSKVLDAFVKQPIMRVIDRRSADAKRRSADSTMLLAGVEDIQQDDPVFILRRVAGARNSYRSSTSRYSAPLDELALQQLATQRESVSDASVVSDKEPQQQAPAHQMTPKEIIAAQRAASRANQRAVVTTQANSERGVDVLLPDRATLRSTRARTDDRMRYSYVLPDGEAYDISEIVERELRGNQSPSGTRVASSEGGDLLEGVMETPRNVMEEKLDRVLNKIRDDKSNGRLGINISAQARQSPSGTSRSSHHRHGSDSSPRLGSSPHQDSDASHYYNGRSPVTPPTTVEARGPGRPVLLRDNFGISELMAVIELSAALRKPAPRPGLSPIDELLFGPNLTIGEIHPSLRDIYEPTFREMQDVDRHRDEHEARWSPRTGGGQLGRMLAASASLLNVEVLFLDVGTQAPAKQVLASTEHIDGSFSDSAKIRELASKVDVLTVEIEHVNVEILELIEREGKVSVQPTPATIRTIQDKYVQKQHLVSHNVRVAESVPVASTVEAIQNAGRMMGYPLMLKSRTLAYDGRGNFVVRSEDKAADALKALGNRPLYAERWAPFTNELAVMVVRGLGGEVKSYPVVETVHKNNICHLVFAPARENTKVIQAARKLAEDAVRTFTGAGVFGVEMFLMPDGALMVNEIAPRPHNSGHYTIEGCYSSQYDNHLRAILSLPLGDTELKVPSAIMLNLIGQTDQGDEIGRVARAALEVPGASTHLYGKAACRPGRKMGHITLVGPSDAQTRRNLRGLLEVMGEPIDQVNLYAPQDPTPGFSHPSPLVGVIMGSDSDLPIMRQAAQILEDFKIPFELTIVSAHRTVDRMMTYARSAAGRGLKVIIAGAGGAAHLPGMVAAMTSLPVIGVPVKGSSLDGVDSLHSIVQMPRGVPVATVAINNSTNAGLLAVRILGTSDPRIQVSMDEYMQNMEKEVLGKVNRLEQSAVPALKLVPVSQKRKDEFNAFARSTVD